MGGSESRLKRRGSGEGGDEEDASSAARQRRETKKKELVLMKLRKQKTYEHCTAEELEAMALDLISEERMKQRYFGDLLRCNTEAVEAVANEKRETIRNQGELQVCMENITREVYQVAAVEVQLALCTLQTHRVQHLAQLFNRYVRQCHYGAFHAAIIINGIVLEWNDSSLVIPRRSSETQWAFKATVHAHAQESASASLQPVPVRAGATETNQHFDHIIEKIDGIRMEKVVLINALVEVAVRYNTKFKYGVFSNNCQDFVKDCLVVIGIDKETVPFEGQIKGLVEQLVKEGATNKVTDNFATHEELDLHIMENITDMTGEDMKYYICLYHVFHTFKDAVPCQKESCQLETLQLKLESSRGLTTS